MSVIFDCFWWWRAEFGGQSHPYIEPDPACRQPTLVNGVDRIHPSLASTEMQLSMGGPPVDVSLLQTPLANNEVFPDWDWAAYLDFPIDIDLSLPNLR